MEKSWLISIQKGNLLFLLLAAALLTSLLLGPTGSAATWCSFQSPVSPISPISPVVGPSGPAPAPSPTTAPAIPTSPASTPVLWIVIGLVVVGTFFVGLVFFQKRRAEDGEQEA